MSTVAEMVQYIVNLGFYSTSESAILAGIHVAAESTSLSFFMYSSVLKSKLWNPLSSQIY